MRRSLIAVAAVVLVSVIPMGAAASVGDEDYLPFYTGEQFQDLYQHAVENVLGNLEQPAGQGEITGDPTVDERIWEMAFERGYLLRQTAGDGLISVDGVVMQPEAAAGWLALEADARAAGYQFIVSSAYRSVTTQQWWFNTQLEGTSDEAIDAALRWYSVPGTSKHHSGYALDFRYSGGTFGEFRDTPDYAWLSADNFRVAKEHGFIPSYPDDVEYQGPNPEPWEFVWVGTDLIRCGVPLDLGESRYASSFRWLAADGDEVECPGGVTVDELDGMLRSLGPKVEALLKA